MKPNFTIAFFLTALIFGAPLAAEQGSPSAHSVSKDQANAPAADLSSAEISKLLELLKPPAPNKEDAQIISQSADITLTPETIMALRVLLERVDLAWKKSINPPILKIKPESLDVSALQAPITLNVRNGYDTFIEFYDAAGRPWPTVKEVMSIGSKELFQADVIADTDSDKKSHIVRVSALDNYGDSTLTIHLAGLSDTANFRLVNNPESKEADFKRIINLPLVNFSASESEFSSTNQVPANPGMSTQIRLAQDAMSAFLNKTPPVGAVSIPVISGDGFVWLYKGDMYSLTPYETLQYPRLFTTMSLAGRSVHKMVPFPRITYLLNGKSVHINLDDEFLMSTLKVQRREVEAAAIAKANGGA